MFRSTLHHRIRRCAAACAALFSVAVSGLSLLPWQFAHAAHVGDGTSALEIRSVRLVNAQQGWVAGRAQLLRTEDAGRSWSKVTPSIVDLATIDAAFFRDANEAWAAATTRAGALTLAHTRDAGASWATNVLSPSLIGDASPLALHFADARNGWLMLRAPSGSNFQRGALLRTRDGGASWETLPSPPIIDRIAFVSADTGWLAGGPQRDRLYATRDGGASWQRQSLPGIDDADTERVNIGLPQFRNAREGTLALTTGDDAAARLLIYDTHDGGKSWLRDESLPAQAVDGNRVAFSAVDAQTVVLAPHAEALVVRSTGAAKREQRLADKLPEGGAIRSLDFTSADHGWLLQQRGVCAQFKAQCHQETRLFLTDDGAQTLVEITPQIAADPAPQPDSVFISHNHKGFDQCAAGTVSQMQSWWTNTPWSDANIYIGGVSRGCSQPNLTATWVKAIFAQGWHLIPTWVGLQAPYVNCPSCSRRMSSDPVTARTQGIAEADAAVAIVNTLKLQTPTVIYYDMEGYASNAQGTGNSDPAVAAFLDGWTARLHELGQTSGVYGSASNAKSDWAGIANPPDAVWIARWNSQASVSDTAMNLGATQWPNQQRIHQYEGGHDETYNNVTFNIDSNYEDAPVADYDCIFCDGFE